MIESFANGPAKHIFQGRWEMCLSSTEPSGLNDCFIDLRLLDAVVSTSDVEVAFKGRIVLVASRRGLCSFIVSSPDTSPNWYQIKFDWTGHAVTNIDVLLKKSTAA